MAPARHTEMGWWPHGEVRFSYDTDDPEVRPLFEQAVSRINASFASELGPQGAPILQLIEVPKDSPEYHLRFVKGITCFTLNDGVGSFDTTVNLHPSCALTGSGEAVDPVFSAMHEIMHAVGFEHELTRHDARTYTRLLTCNLKDGVRGAGDIHSPDPTSCGINPTQSSQWEADSKKEPYALGSEYDFLSVMHYSPWATSREENGVRLQSWELQEGILSAQFPQLAGYDEFLALMAARHQLSPGDIAAVKRIYGGGVSDLAVTQEVTMRCKHGDAGVPGCERFRTSMKYRVTSKGPWESPAAVLTIDLPASNIHTSGPDKYTWTPQEACVETGTARLRCDLGALDMFEPVEVEVSVYTTNDQGLTFKATVAHGAGAGVEDLFAANDQVDQVFTGTLNRGCSLGDLAGSSSTIPVLMIFSALGLAYRRPFRARRIGQAKGSNKTPR